MVRYEAFGERLYASEIGWYVSYGIRAYQKTGSRWDVILSVSDVSPDREEAEKLAQRCTAGQLSPIHLRDVIEDQL